MAILSNINDKFAVDSSGGIQFSGQTGTAGYVLKSNGNAAPTWVDGSTVIGGPYLPLSGGTLTGATATATGISVTVGGHFNANSTTTLGGAVTIEGNLFMDGYNITSIDELSASTGTFSASVTAAGNSNSFGTTTFSGIITAQSSSSGDYVRLYGSSGTGKWDIYGNGANLRISDNESAGILAVDTGATFGGNVTANGYLMSNGSLTTSSFWGTLITAGTGSYADFALIDSGTTRIMHVPTGTRNVVFESKIGIGNTNPSRPLDVTSDSSAVALRLRARTNNDYSFMQFTNNAGTGLWSEIYATGAASSATALHFSVGTATVEKMKLTTSLMQLTTGAANQGVIQMSTDAAYQIRGGGNYGYLSLVGPSLRFDTNGSQRMKIDSGGTVEIGGTIQANGGIKLGGTATANKLDFYQQGIWTPTLKFGGNEVGITYGGVPQSVYRGGHYVKIGNVVTFSMRIILTSKGTSTGQATFTGLPYDVGSLAGNYGSAMYTFANNFAIPERASITMDSGSSIIRLRFTNSSGNYVDVTNGTFNNNSDIILTGTYISA